MEQIVDLDEVLMSWANHRLGYDYVVEKVDTSKLHVKQQAVIYKGGGSNWWENDSVHNEYFENESGQKQTWHFSHCIKNVRSHASWSVIKAFRSSKVLPMLISLEYPCSPKGTPPLAVTFDTAMLHQQIRKATDVVSQWSYNQDLVVDPYGSQQVDANVRTCVLDNVDFSTDITMAGSVRVVGHKRNRKFSKHEITVGIADALARREYLGFKILESFDSAGSSRYVSFRVEGMCNGRVGVEANVTTSEINTCV